MNWFILEVKALKLEVVTNEPVSVLPPPPPGILTVTTLPTLVAVTPAPVKSMTVTPVVLVTPSSLIVTGEPPEFKACEAVTAYDDVVAREALSAFKALAEI